MGMRFACALFAIFAAVLVIAQPAVAAGNTTVDGHLTRMDPLYPDVHIGPFYTLDSLDLRANGNVSNNLVMTAIDYKGPQDLYYQCEGGPLARITGPCHANMYPTNYYFADSSRTFGAATGGCRLTNATLAQCTAGTKLVPEFYLQEMPVHVSLGDGNDRFAFGSDGGVTAVERTWREQFAFNIEGGAGDDTIILLDRTYWESPSEGYPYSTGVDHVSCGAGKDKVVALAGTIAASDCESVTIIPAGNTVGPV